MKKTILFTYLLFTLTLLVAQAQVAANRSRLDMAYKKQPVGLDRPALMPKPSVIEYKPLALQKPQALTNYYRALLFAHPVVAANTSVESTANPTAQIERADRRTTGFEEKVKGPEEQLYSSDRITVSNVYPNPASDFAEFDYTINGSVQDVKVIFYNVLGSPVAEYTLDKNERNLHINTRELPTGMYFYQLAVEGKKVATKKMLIRHQ
ncbi:MAG: T9SS type A sorting domain-containing protein, partial [Bacteroidetes bacterium]|nr:T9SS type A sorting domain-containing protein [Bacteroidota bacterium]